MSQHLTPQEHAEIEKEISLLLGAPPTLQSLRAEGLNEERKVLAVVEFIQNAGRVITLSIAETLQSLAVLLIGLFFAILEYDRIFHGAKALGQGDAQASLISLAFVAANVITPIYILRGLRGQSEIRVLQGTVRGYLSSFLKRIFGKPVYLSKNVYHNPTLHIAATVITWATIFLAVYDILGPVIARYTSENTPWFTSVVNLLSSDLTTFVQLMAGLALSIGGVFFLQSAAHPIDQGETE